LSLANHGRGWRGYYTDSIGDQSEVVVIAACFSELWHSQMKEYKSISRVNL